MTQEEIKCLRCEEEFNKKYDIKRKVVAKEAMVCPFCGGVLSKTLYLLTAEGVRHYLKNMILYDDTWVVIYTAQLSENDELDLNK